MRSSTTSQIFHIVAVMLGVTGCLAFVLPLEHPLSSLGLDGALSERTLRFLPYAIGWLCLALALAVWFAPRLAAGVSQLLTRLDHLSLRAFVSLLVIVALTVRLIWLFAVPSTPYTDYAVYNQLAHNLVAGKGYVEDLSKSGEDAGKLDWRPPGLPYMLAAAYSVFGENLNVGKGVILVFSVGLVLLTYLLSKTAFGELAGRVAGLITALFPSLIAYTSVLATEPPFICFFLLTLWLMIRERRWYWLILAGVAFGISALIRPTIISFTAVIPIYYLLKSRSLRKTALKTLAIVATALVVILPWTLRNYQVFGSFVLLTTNSGTVLWEGTQTNAAGDAAKGSGEYCVGLNEIQCDQTLRQLAIQNILADPIGYARYSVTKLVRLFLFDYEAVVQATQSTTEPWNIPSFVRPALMIGAEIYYLDVAALTLIGTGITLRRHQWTNEYSLYWLIFLLWAGIHFVFHGESRYHMPLLPLMAGLAAVAITRFRTAQQ